MSRQTQTNTFNDGLNKDLNPLLTPNTVMTDCLNGTIVTYNGNEFALQNDMGNYKFNHGSLSDGFVPVGIKEHANILYIVSYNPINDEVEIGSFPSSKTIYKSEINNSSDSVELTLDGVWINYTDLAKQSQLTLLSPLEEDYKLNPGDMYILEKNAGSDYDQTLEKINKESLWQHTSTYIFTENNKLYNIDKFVEFSADRSSSTYLLEDFNHIKWDVPGWIAVKPMINVMDEFNCYVHKLDYNIEDGGFITGATINIQSVWPTNIYKNKIQQISDNLGYLVYGYDNENDIILNDDIFNHISECTNHIKSYNDIYSVIHSEIKIDTKCKHVKIIPVLWVNNNKNENPDSGDHYIVYDQFATIVSLEQKEWNKDDVSFGVDIFNYYVDKNELILSFDLNAPVGARISYQLKRYLDPEYFTGENVKDELKNVFESPQEIEDVVKSGQNIISIPFYKEGDGRNYNKITPTKYNYFDKEDYYQITFYIYTEYPKDINLNEIIGTDLCKDITKELYISEYINYYHGLYDNYDCDEFHLNKEAFIEAIEREMRFNDVQFNGKNDIIKIEDDIIPDDKVAIQNKLNGYYYENESVKKTNSTNPRDFDINPEIKYGKKYISKTPEIIKLKNQNDNIGRFWYDTEILNLTIKGIDENDNYIQINNDENGYSLDVLSELTINSVNYSITKTYPEDPLNYKSMYTVGGFIEEDADEAGWYKFNENALMWKDSGRSGYSCGTWKPKSYMKFKIVNDTITIKINDSTATYEYGVNGWIIPENDYSLLRKFTYNFDWVNNDKTDSGDPAKCRKNVSLKLKYPGYVVFYNNRDNNWSYYYGIDNTEYNEHFGMRNLIGGLFDENADNRYFYGIAVSGRPDDLDFFLILPTTIEFDDGYKYMMKSFLTYLYMMVFVKYCVKSETNTYYIPRYAINDNKIQKITLNKLEYYSQIKYCYSKLDGNKCENQIEISYDQEFNETFHNNMDWNWSKSVGDFFTKLNDDINTSADFDFNEINSNEMFVDKNYIGALRPILNNIALMLDYKGGYFKLKEIVKDYKLTMRSSDNNYGHVCHINNICYDEI